MNVFEIIVVPRWWAKAQYGVSLTDFLKKRGVNVWGVTEPGSQVLKKFKQFDIPVIALRIRNSIFFPVVFFQILWHLKRKKVEIVNIHQMTNFFIIALAAKICGAKVVRTKTDSHPVKLTYFNKFFYKM